MFILNFIINVLYLYLTVYAIYLLTLNIKAFQSKNYIKDLKETQNLLGAKENKLCVIVWAKDKTQKALEILQMLNAQTYNHENYEVHLISAYTNKNFAKLPDFAHGARIHNIENSEFFSRDKAVSVFAEKMLAENKFDAFVFLSSDRLIEGNYLECINNNLKENEVLTGKLDIEADKSNFLAFITSNILRAKQKFTNSTFELSRKMFDLPSTIDGDNCVIKNETLEKIGRVCFETKNDELKYSLFLASNKIKPQYCPFIKTRILPTNFNASSTNVFQRLSLFKYYLPLLPKKPLYFTEFVLLLLKPNAVFTTFIYFALLYLTFRYIFYIGVKEVVFLGAFYIFNIVLGLFTSKITFTEGLLLPLYPFYSLILKYENFARNITIKNIKKQIKDDENVNSATIKAFVANDKKAMICKLDLVSEDGMRKVVFRYNRKKLFSDSCVRMHDAMLNITKKLQDKGYSLKICQNCSHFEIKQDGTVDLLKGTCKLLKKANGENEQVLIWNGCMNFARNKENGVFDLNDNKETPKE